MKSRGKAPTKPTIKPVVKTWFPTISVDPDDKTAWTFDVSDAATASTLYGSGGSVIPSWLKGAMTSAGTSTSVSSPYLVSPTVTTGTWGSSSTTFKIDYPLPAMPRKAVKKLVDELVKERYPGYQP